EPDLADGVFLSEPVRRGGAGLINGIPPFPVRGADEATGAGHHDGRPGSNRSGFSSPTAPRERARSCASPAKASPSPLTPHGERAGVRRSPACSQSAPREL